MALQSRDRPAGAAAGRDNRAGAPRLLASELLTLLLVALLVVFAQHERSTYYFDAALIVALLTFVGIVAAERYYRLGRPFRCGAMC